MIAELHYMGIHFQEEILPKCSDLQDEMRQVPGQVVQILERLSHPLPEETEFYALLLSSGYPRASIDELLTGIDFIAYEFTLDTDEKLSSLILYFLDENVLQSLTLAHNNPPKRIRHGVYGSDAYVDFIESLQKRGALFMVPKGIIGTQIGDET